MALVPISGRSAAFGSWLSMMRRCFIETEPIYRHYGGRGITVCERWYDWRNFLEDMGNRPDGMSLDRIDNSGDYGPSNCRWTDARTQNRNTRRNSWVDVGGTPTLACDAAELLGVSRSAVSRRRSAGKITPDQAKQIKDRLASGGACKDIAAELCISRQQVQGIRDGRVWRIV
jgi:hypothetical protein